MESLLQTRWWAEFKSQFGWQLFKPDQRSYGLVRSLPLGLSVRYFPELPYSERTLRLVGEFQQNPDRGDYIFTRFEFLEPWQPSFADTLLRLGLVKACEEVQPEYRQWLSLDQPLRQIFAQMKPKGRYNIRVAERHRLTVRHGCQEELVRIFFDLYQQTGRRADFQTRQFTYFQQLVCLLEREKLGEVIVVSRQARPLAAGIFTYYRSLASYLYGGSSGDRSFMASYLLHWQAIKRAKRRGCRCYDLLAVSPPNQPNHPYANLTRFKSQFGGRTVRLMGSWDLVGRPFWYIIYKLVEQKRRKVVG